MTQTRRLPVRAIFVSSLIVAALTAAAWSQTLIVVVFQEGVATLASLEISGTKVAPVLGLLLLASAIAAIVSRVARGAWRRVVSAFASLLALSQVVIIFQVLLGPATFTRRAIAEMTGVADLVGQANLIASVTPSGWTIIVLIGAMLQVVLLGIVTVNGSSSTQRSTRYQRPTTRRTSADPELATDATEAWDELSRGADPTASPS